MQPRELIIPRDFPLPPQVHLSEDGVEGVESVGHVHVAELGGVWFVGDLQGVFARLDELVALHVEESDGLVDVPGQYGRQGTTPTCRRQLTGNI